ncbi:MAG: biosynthetic-type acetolactate synthase large subunit [Deltaproteobacteria bacterium]|nr:biosynthetic-type acetolactate synthase large subunit [Deltaproteobacteria bacterium]
MKQTGAEILIATLAELGVDTIFGYPGASSLPIHDCLRESPIRHYLVRHEQAAAHAADGYARATGATGVCLATSGPGATNLVTGIATAYMDSTPMIALTGQVSTNLLGSDAFQETDIVGITMPITKHSFLINDVSLIESTVQEAFEIARSGRPGPVLIDLPQDVMAAVVTERITANRPSPKKDHYTSEETIDRLKKIAKHLNNAEKPVILIGGGIKLAQAFDELQELVEKGQIPFVSTMMGIGSLKSPHDLNLGFIGTHGNEPANHSIHRSDFILAIGVRFTNRSTSIVEEFAPLATIAQIDIDPTSIGKNIKADLSAVCDIRKALGILSPLLEHKDRREWLSRIKKKHELMERDDKSNGCGAAGLVVQKVQENMPEGTIGTADVGLNQIWTLRNWRALAPRTLITSGGMGTMGFSLPAAVGASVGKNRCPVIAFTGDGGLLMNIQELATVGFYQLPVKIVLFNNGHLGMIRQIQDLWYGARFADSYLGNHMNFTAIARGFGLPAAHVSAENPEAGIREMCASDGPFFLEVEVDCQNYVYPIIPPGRSNVEMIYDKAT